MVLMFVGSTLNGLEYYRMLWYAIVYYSCKMSEGFELPCSEAGRGQLSYPYWGPHSVCINTTVRKNGHGSTSDLMQYLAPKQRRSWAFLHLSRGNVGLSATMMKRLFSERLDLETQRFEQRVATSQLYTIEQCDKQNHTLSCAWYSVCLPFLGDFSLSLPSKATDLVTP